MINRTRKPNISNAPATAKLPPYVTGDTAKVLDELGEIDSARNALKEENKELTRMAQTSLSAAARLEHAKKKLAEELAQRQEKLGLSADVPPLISGQAPAGIAKRQEPPTVSAAKAEAPGKLSAATMQTNTPPNIVTPVPTPPTAGKPASWTLPTNQSISLAPRVAKMRAAIDAAVGNGAAERICARPIERIQLSTADGLHEGDAEMGCYSEIAAQRKRAGFAAKAQARAVSQQGETALQQQLSAMLQWALDIGVNIPGESFRGMAPKGTVEPLDAKRLAIAQRRIEMFSKVLDGDEAAGASRDSAAQAAREFIRATTGKKFTIGATLRQKG